ncbi:MAG: hypothetical protein KDN19_11075 [Verrucomicrobiae bacterium]|nr:hypothetical protein [Verrucomicrobiae bacterium]
MAEGFRSFTNREGNQIEAVTLGVDLKTSSASLRLRDGREFAVPIASLSLDDQAWLVAWEKERRATRDPGGWKSVVVTLPQVMSRIEAPGCHGAFYRIGLKTWRGEIPEGAWLRVSDVVDGKVGNYVAEPELILRFDGFWNALEVTFEGGLFRASFDGAAPVVVGATGSMASDGVIPQPVPGRVFDRQRTQAEQEEFLRKVRELVPEGRRICFQPAITMQEPVRRRYRDLFEALVIAGDYQISLLDFVDYWQVRGLRVEDDLSLQSLDPSHLSTLEYLGVEKNIEDIDKLAGFEALSVVELGRIDGQSGLDHLAKVPNLRLVEVGSLRDDDTTFSLTGWDQLPKLQGIDFDLRYCRIDAQSVGRCLGLRSMCFEDYNQDPAGGWMRNLAALRNAYWSSRLDAAPLIEMAQASAWSPGMRSVKNWNTTPFTHLPSLRAIVHPGSVRKRTLTRTNSEGQQVTLTGELPYLWPNAGIEGAEFLEYIEIDGVSQEMLDAIFAKVNPGSVRTLVLSNLLDCTDLSGLARLENLRVLSLSHFDSVFRDAELGEIDVRPLKSLEILEVISNGSSPPPRVLHGEVIYKDIGDSSPRAKFHNF